MTALLSQYLDKYCRITPQANGYTRATIKTYRHWIQSFALWIEDVDGHAPDVEQFAYPRLRDYATHRMSATTFAERSINSMYAAFRSFGAFLVDESVCDANPAAKLKNVKTHTPKRSLMSEAEAIAIVDACNRYADANRERLARAVLNVLLHGGMRRAEFFGLTSADWHAKERRLWIGRGKGGESRSVYLNETAAAALDAYNDARPAKCLHDHLFYLNATFPVSLNTVTGIFRETWAMAGLDKKRKITMHSCRHRYITALIANGADIGTVQKLAGHKSPQTTLTVYYHPETDRLRAVSDLSAFRSDTPAPPAPAEPLPPLRMWSSDQDEGKTSA